MGTFMLKRWNTLLSLATALCAIFSGFIIAVPAGGGDNLWFRYGRFLVAVCIGLWFVPVHAWDLRRHRWGWWFIGALLAFCSLCGVVEYAQLVDRYTIQYWHNERIIAGETILPDAQRYLEKLRIQRPSASVRDVLEASAGDPARVWEPSEIETRVKTITLMYLLNLLLLSGTVVAITQAAYCATRRK
jgi:hypothetical protein